MVAPNPTEHPLFVEVEDLKTYFFLHEGTVKAVDGVSFKIYEGKSLGVIGESGCGKSVTAQSMMRIVPTPPGREVGGKITLYLKQADGNAEIVDVLKLNANGVENARHPRQADRHDLPGADDLLQPACIPSATRSWRRCSCTCRASPRRKPASAPSICWAAWASRAPQRLIDNYPHQFCGGMRQRAMIAMALVCGPRLLIGDEPTTALDVTIEAQILELIKDLQNDLGMALMYISHDLTVVGQVADEIMVMYLGMAMEHASTDEIFDNPLHPYTIALWRSIPSVEGGLKRLVPISGVLPSPYMVQPGLSVLPALRAQHAGYLRCFRTALERSQARA